MSNASTAIHTPRHRRNPFDLDAHHHFLASSRRAVAGYEPSHRRPPYDLRLVARA
jgi:hypothetical protein